MQYPRGYLKRAFDAIHEKGGVCISDEVQTGFGRTGEDYWGFQAHGIKPDIGTSDPALDSDFWGGWGGGLDSDSEVGRGVDQ